MAVLVPPIDLLSPILEYLYLPAVRMQYASEFGHLIRILTIFAKMEYILDELNDSKVHANPIAALNEAEQKMDEWDRTLPEHLHFSEQNLQVQQSMFETSSNTGAWCWCMLHIYYASCVLALNFVRQRPGGSSSRHPQWAVDRIELILQMLGDRAKNSILLGCALWTLVKFCQREDSQVRKWAGDYEEHWGIKIFELVQDWRSNPSPLLLPQYPSPLQSQQHTPFHGLIPGPSHEPMHRRLSDVRTSGSQQSYSQNHSSPNSSRLPPSQRQDAPPYNSSNIGNQLKRSASHSPPMPYALGQPSSNYSSIRSFEGSQHADDNLPDSAVANKGSSTSAILVAGPSTGVPSIGQSNNATDSTSAKSGKDNNSRWHFAGIEASGSSGSVISSGDSTSSRYAGSTCNVTRANQPGFLGRVDTGNGSGNGAAGGGTVGSSRNGSSQGDSPTRRNFPPLGDGVKSLPSLKASGLLDAWGSHRNSDVADAQQSSVESPRQIQPVSLTSPRRTMPDAGANISKLILPSAFVPKTHSDSTDLRPTPTLQPVSVGPPWLAKESR